MHACNMHLLTIVPTYDDIFLTMEREYTRISAINIARVRLLLHELRY
jgi:hypothetical protein